MMGVRVPPSPRPACGSDARTRESSNFSLKQIVISPMETALVANLALTLGVGWASGINLYASILTLGLAQALGYVSLPPELALLSNPLVLAAAGCMYLVEFFVDKVPGVDSGWDLLHTFIRIPAGALLAAGAASGMQINEALQLAAAILGGGLSAGSHFTKAGSRLLINTSPEPVSNWLASISEDIAVVGGLWAALVHPWVFLAFLALFLVLLAWALPRLWRALGTLFSKLGRLFGMGGSRPPAGGESGAVPERDGRNLPRP